MLATDWVSQTCTRQTFDESSMQDTHISKSRDKSYKKVELVNSNIAANKFFYKEVSKDTM